MKQVVLYIIQLATGPIKIGIAADAEKRLNAIRVDNPYDPGIIHAQLGTARDEAELLAALASEALTGEWVADTPRTRFTLNEFFGFALPYRRTTETDAYHKRLVRARRREERAKRPRAISKGPIRTKTVRRRLSDGTEREYTYQYRGATRIGPDGEPIVRITTAKKDNVPPRSRGRGPRKLVLRAPKTQDVSFSVSPKMPFPSY